MNGKVVGAGSYEPTPAPGVAEVAFAVTDDMHGRGVATLLLEHLVSLARIRHLAAFTADTLGENSGMLRVFTDAGLGVRRHWADGVAVVDIPIPRQPALIQASVYLEAVAGREGASRRRQPGTAAPSCLRRGGGGEPEGGVGRPGDTAQHPRRPLRRAGLRGESERRRDRRGPVRSLGGAAGTGGSRRDRGAAPAVSAAAQECGERGIKALVVITAGLGRAEETGIVAICRHHGMRLAGPNCFGVAVPGIGLDATFGARHPAPGRAGMVVQSGGIGIALLEHLSRLGIGISSFASVGDKLDVSGNDMLRWWEQDGTTKLAVLYLESFGNPRKFARTASRVGKTMPVLTVHAGRSAPGQRAAASHTAAIAAPLITRP